MNDEKMQGLFEQMLREALLDEGDFPMPKPAKKAVASCGCEDECGDVSTHNEDTVLVGRILNP